MPFEEGGFFYGDLEAGILLFSGSLYLKALALADVTLPLAPTGGVLLMAGWLALGWAGLASLRRP